MPEQVEVATGSRLAFVDALKALAAQLIVLHHLAFYGPMSDHAYPLLPALLSWLSQDARMAVQAFLVIGGFLAARSLAPEGELRTGRPPALLWQRYLKLVTPYLAAVLLAIVCAAIARELMTHDSLPGEASVPQMVAHALLLQSILGFEGLSAGVWYIAIDFQLFAIFLGLLWLARSLGRGQRRVIVLGTTLVAALALVSLYYFNRHAEWDVYGFYFFGAYALGVLTYWANRPQRSRLWPVLIVLPVFVALYVDYRSRIVVALLVALALGVAQRRGFLATWPRSRLISRLGQVSYALFLVHFPVCMVVNGLFARFAPPDPLLNLAGMVVAWLFSLLAGAFFYHFVEGRGRHPPWRPGLAGNGVSDGVSDKSAATLQRTGQSS